MSGPSLVVNSVTLTRSYLIKCSATGETFPIFQNMYCTTKHVLYTITCMKDTGSKDTKCVVGVHYRGGTHSQADMLFLPFENVKSKVPFILSAREELWINKYQTIEHGLNKNRS